MRQKNKSNNRTPGLIIIFLVVVIVLQWFYLANTKKQPVKRNARGITKTSKPLARKSPPIAIAPVMPMRTKPQEPAYSYKGTIAIVIDDWGYNLNNIALLAEITQPVTCAILPNLANTASVVEHINNMGQEVILHLPMQPKSSREGSLEKDTILISWNDSLIRSVLEKDLDSVRYARGISNHMGSLATADTRVMKVIFEYLRKRNLYFLDSYVTTGSIGESLAKKTGVGFARRDIFLDNKDDPAYIKQQFAKLQVLARRYNRAVIGIGHDRRNTILVLKELMPQAEKEGYKLVFISETLQ